MSSTKKKAKGAKKRVQRATSNVFAMFEQSQIQEFKEAFNIIDQNRDGFIDMEDLKDMFASLGQEKPDKYLEEMLNEATGPINFTMFMTLFGEKMNGTDPEEVIRGAFAPFDPDATGKIHEEPLRRMLMEWCDRFTEDEWDQMCHDAPFDDEGFLNYVKYTKIIKHGKDDDKED